MSQPRTPSASPPPASYHLNYRPSLINYADILASPSPISYPVQQFEKTPSTYASLSDYTTFTNVRHIERNILCMTQTANNFKQMLHKFVDIMHKHEKLDCLQKMLLLWFRNKNINKYLNNDIITDVSALFGSINNSVIETQAISDSVALSELMFDTNYRNLSILQFPTDILININQYLKFVDLNKLQKTCRYLRIVSRNPLSLYNLEINCYSNSNFSGYCHNHIQHLTFSYKSIHASMWMHYNRKTNENWYNTVHTVTLSTESMLEMFGLNGYQTERMMMEYNGEMMVNLNNIRCLTIKAAVENKSFYEFILRSFKYVEHLTIYETGSSAEFMMNEFDISEIHLFDHLETVHYVTNHGNISESFTHGLFDLNKKFFTEKPVKFMLTIDECLDVTDEEFQSINKNIFNTFCDKFNEIYLKISYQNMNLLNSTLSNVLKYLSLHTRVGYTQFVCIETVRVNSQSMHESMYYHISGQQYIYNDDKNTKFEATHLISHKKPTENALQIRIEIENECFSGYLCSESDIRLENEYSSWKILTETVDDNVDQIIFECDKVRAFKMDSNDITWRGICQDGKVVIHYNLMHKVAIVRVIDNNDKRAKVLQYIDGKIKLYYGNGCVVWPGDDYVEHNMSPITSQFRLQFMNNERDAKQFVFCFNQYIEEKQINEGNGNDHESLGCDNTEGSSDTTDHELSWTESTESVDDESDVWALERGFSASETPTLHMNEEDD